MLDRRGFLTKFIKTLGVTTAVAYVGVPVLFAEQKESPEYYQLLQQCVNRGEDCSPILKVMIDSYEPIVLPPGICRIGGTLDMRGRWMYIPDHASISLMGNTIFTNGRIRISGSRSGSDWWLSAEKPYNEVSNCFLKFDAKEDDRSMKLVGMSA